MEGSARSLVRSPTRLPAALLALLALATAPAPARIEISVGESFLADDSEVEVLSAGSEEA